MAVELKPEQERVIHQAIEAGLIDDADDVVELGIETIRLRLGMRLRPDNSMNAEAWSQDLHDWVQSHTTATPLLSDEAIGRDSIYGTRGQ
jgi:hypothetical protein